MRGKLTGAGAAPCKSTEWRWRAAKTGKPEAIAVEAASADGARRIASERGWVVGRVSDVPPTPQAGSATPQSRDKRAVWIVACGCVGVAGGALGVGYQWGKTAENCRAATEGRAMVDDMLTAERDKWRASLRQYADLYLPMAKRRLIRPSDRPCSPKHAKAREEAAKWLDAKEVERLLPASSIPDP